MQVQNSQEKRIVLPGSGREGHLFRAIGSEEEICRLIKEVHDEYGIFIAAIGHLVELDINIINDTSYVKNQEEVLQLAKYYSIIKANGTGYVQICSPQLYERVKAALPIKTKLCFLEAFALDWFEYESLDDEIVPRLEIEETEFSINVMNAIDRLNADAILDLEEEDYIVDYYKCIDYWYQKLDDMEPANIDQIASKYLDLLDYNENEITIDNSEYRIINPHEDDATWEAFKGLYPPGINYSEHDYLLFGVVDSDSVAVGAAALKFEDEEYTITWIYVIPEKRRVGVGTYLVERIIAFTNSTSEFYDLKLQFTSKDIGMREFVDSLASFEVNEEVTDYLVTYEELVSNPLYAKMLALEAKATSYIDLSDSDKANIIEALKAARIIDITDYAVLEKQLIKELSLCHYTSKEDFAIIWIKKGQGENDLEFVLFYANNRTKAAQILAAVINIYSKEYRNYSLKITPVSDEGDEILEKFSPNRLEVGKRYTAEWMAKLR